MCPVGRKIPMINSSRSLFIIYILTTLFACGGGGGEVLGSSNINKSNNPPSKTFSLNSIGNKSVLSGESLNFTLSVSNANGNNVTYTTDGNLGGSGNVYMMSATFG